jgi:hypothetical protein
VRSICDMDERPFNKDRSFTDLVHRIRDALDEQVRQSQLTIEESLALLQRMDGIIAKAGKKM